MSGWQSVGALGRQDVGASGCQDVGVLGRQGVILRQAAAAGPCSSSPQPCMTFDTAHVRFFGILRCFQRDVCLRPMWIKPELKRTSSELRLWLMLHFRLSIRPRRPALDASAAWDAAGASDTPSAVGARATVPSETGRDGLHRTTLPRRHSLCRLGKKSLTPPSRTVSRYAGDCVPKLFPS